ncbi:MAG: DNA mismatch repair endonuclease MutL [Dissulfurispiraceae bacterium]
MAKINLLSINLRNQIAAGEVVERPASVVKELIENSIDAGSHRIHIEVVGAGKKLIKVSDNGEGMDREDALLAVKRYATSKISEERDLASISTMGFRGEALSSIAAVSKMRMITALKDVRSSPDTVALRGFHSMVGTCLEVIGGEIMAVKDCPSIGTSLEVRELFFNTPARRKFLKSDTTENNQIIDVVTREALSHYAIAFILQIDKDEVLNLPDAKTLKERLVQIYGLEFVQELIETAAESHEMVIWALMGKPTNERNSRTHQFLYINRRPVRDQTVTHAVYRAYESFIPRENHPVYFIFLEIAPAKIDVNIHPTKREVRFEDARSVFNFVYRAVRSTVVKRFSETHNKDITVIGGSEGKGLGEVEIERLTSAETHRFAERSLQQISDTMSTYSEGVPFSYLGDTFVAISANNGLTLIDYHAAHERINYERFLNRANLSSSKLLFPQQVTLPINEYKLLLENTELLNEFGMEVEDFGQGTLIIRSIPDILKNADLRIIMSDMVASIANRDVVNDRGSRSMALGNKAIKVQLETTEEIASVAVDPLIVTRKIIAAKLACHASLRGKEIPDSARLASLIRDLDATECPDYCPHGRPTRIFISLDELRKMFKK